MAEFVYGDNAANVMRLWHPPLVCKSLLCGDDHSLLILVVVINRFVDDGDVLYLGNFRQVLTAV